jgi:hypothetical protein
MDIIHLAFIIDKDFIDDSLLDVIFLEYLIYAIQLKSFGLSDESIRKAIDEKPL